MCRVHLLTDNRDISKEEYLAADCLFKELRKLHLETRLYVEQFGLDSKTFLPGNVWAEINNPDHANNWTYDMVNYVKCISPFIGFHPMMWGRMDVPGEVDASLANDVYKQFFSGELKAESLVEQLERKFNLSERIRNSQQELIDSYKELVSDIPKQYHILAPPRAGEIGVWYKNGIINPDVIIYQRRIKALYAGNALQAIEDAIATQGSANYLEIGPGYCFFAYALAQCFPGKLNVFLVDLPFVINNGCAYLTCVVGANQVGLVTKETLAAIEKPYIFVPNYLVPAYEQELPDFHLIHNAISFNEMNSEQVNYYFDFVARHLAKTGVFHIAGGFKLLDYHVDALGAALERFSSPTIYPGSNIEGYQVVDGPNTFIRTENLS